MALYLKTDLVFACGSGHQKHELLWRRMMWHWTDGVWPQMWMGVAHTTGSELRELVGVWYVCMCVHLAYSCVALSSWVFGIQLVFFTGESCIMLTPFPTINCVGTNSYFQNKHVSWTDWRLFDACILLRVSLLHVSASYQKWAKWLGPLPSNRPCFQQAPIEYLLCASTWNIGIKVPIVPEFTGFTFWRQKQRISKIFIQYFKW